MLVIMDSIPKIGQHNNNAAAAQYLHNVDQMHTIAALHARIATLETRLEHSASEKNAADQTIRYLLQLIANLHHASPSCNSENRKENCQLRQELNDLKKENSELRCRMDKLALLWAEVVRSQKTDLDLKSSPKAEDSRLSHAGKPKSALPNLRDDKEALLDLRDFDVSTDHVQGLDHSDIASSGSVDDVHNYAPGLPKIDLGSRTGRITGVGKADSPETLKQSDSSYLHHFTSSPQKLAMDLGEKNDTPAMRAIQISENLSDDPKKISELHERSTETRGCRYFKSRIELRNSIEINRRAAGPQDLTFPNLFRFGLQYSPLAGEQNRNAFRTISIMNLPPGISRAELLGKIRGGALVSLKLLDTLSIGFLSSLIEFVHEKDARAFVSFTADFPIYFGKQRAHVSLLTTPTWPLSTPLNTSIFNLRHTRCLEVSNFPRSITPTVLRQHLRVHPAMVSDAIAEISMQSGGTSLFLGFTSILEAGKAHKTLTNFPSYSQCNVAYVPDPCSFPLGMLKENREMGGTGG